MLTVVVVSDPKDWPIHAPGVEVVASRTYLTDVRMSELRQARVYNLCRSYRYQNNGWYVSLLATARGHDHVHGRAQRVVALHTRVVEGEAGRIGAETLPGFHLALIAPFGDLEAPIDGWQGMHRIGRIALGIDVRLGRARGQSRPMGFGSFAERRNQAYTGDDDVAGVHAL